MFVAWWVGCGGSADGGPPPVDGADPSGDTGAETLLPHTGTEPSPPDVAGMAAALQQAIGIVVASPTPCADRYDAALAAASDARCPPFFQTGNPASWDTVCTSQVGAEFRGLLSRWDDLDAYAEETLRDALTAHADLAPGNVGGPIVVARSAGLDGSASVSFDGQNWTFAGELFDVIGADGDLAFAHHAVRGVCESTTPLGAPWTDLALPLWLDVTALRGPAGSWLSADGSLSDLPGAFDTVTFVDVVFDDTACAAEPVGTVELRGVGGERTSLTFGGGCDGCAAVPGARDAVCVDFAAWRSAVPVMLP